LERAVRDRLQGPGEALGLTIWKRQNRLHCVQETADYWRKQPCLKTIDRSFGRDTGPGTESVLRQSPVDEIQSPYIKSVTTPHSPVGETAKSNRRLHAMNGTAYKRYDVTG